MRTNIIWTLVVNFYIEGCFRMSDEIQNETHEPLLYIIAAFGVLVPLFNKPTIDRLEHICNRRQWLNSIPKKTRIYGGGLFSEVPRVNKVQMQRVPVVGERQLGNEYGIFSERGIADGGGINWGNMFTKLWGRPLGNVQQENKIIK